LLEACSPQGVTAQQSAARIARAIEMLRNAPNAGKAGLLKSLVELGCTGPDVCETRDACQRAYTLHVDAVGLTQTAKRQLQEGKTPQAAQLLITAQEKLSEASRKVADCTDREAALRRRYKL
jgi:hypothetical protein